MGAEEAPKQRTSRKRPTWSAAALETTCQSHVPLIATFCASRVVASKTSPLANSIIGKPGDVATSIHNSQGGFPAKPAPGAPM